MRGDPTRLLARRALPLIFRSVALAVLALAVVASARVGFWVGRSTRAPAELARGDAAAPARQRVAIPPGPVQSSSDGSGGAGELVAASPVAVPGDRPAASFTLGGASEYELIRGELARGGTLGSSLHARGVSERITQLIVRETGSLFDFRYSRPGDRYTLVLDRDGELLRFQYATSPIASVRLIREGDVFRAERIETPLYTKRARTGGVISSSLYDAILELDATPQLAHDFVDIFAWDVDFSRAVQPGDEFGILYESYYRYDAEDGEVFARPGRILAARYRGAVGTHEVSWFQTESGRGGYYRPDGTSVQRQFLAAPLKYGRISSRYTRARRHPILNVTRPHFGIDYAAPAGTPIWAVSDGTVSFKGSAGGFGRLVKIQHGNGYESYYAHLSRFAPGLRVGDRVRQKQILGSVGSSGLATGPHVCFRIAKDGRYVDPAKLRAPAGPPVPSHRRLEFLAQHEALFRDLDGAPRQLATLEAL